jgi:hypothetical protein
MQLSVLIPPWPSQPSSHQRSTRGISYIAS